MIIPKSILILRGRSCCNNSVNNNIGYRIIASNGSTVRTKLQDCIIAPTRITTTTATINSDTRTTTTTTIRHFSSNNNTSNYKGGGGSKKKKNQDRRSNNSNNNNNQQSQQQSNNNKFTGVAPVLSKFRPQRQTFDPNYIIAQRPAQLLQKSKVRRKAVPIATVPLVNPTITTASSSSRYNVNDDDGYIDIFDNKNSSLESRFGPLGADMIRDIQRRHDRMTFYNGFEGAGQSLTKNDNNNKFMEPDSAEESLRMLDYFLAEPGSVEDRVMERRALAYDIPDEDERERFLQEIDALIEEQKLDDLGVGEENKCSLPKPKKKTRKDYDKELANIFSNQKDDDDDDDDAEYDDDDRDEFGNIRDDDIDKDDDYYADRYDNDGDDDDDEDKDPQVNFDPHAMVHGEWSEMLVQVDRNVKLWRGGRLESFRALVIGGNLNGCGGFAVGKSVDPIQAVEVASRKCKRNIFFVDRYQNNGLTRDLVGKQNSCKLIIRSTDNGLRGNPLVREILKRFGITNAVAKAHGNRSPFNVVRATFKALQTHESIHDIALKRGKRIVSIDRALRLQV